MTTVSVVTGGAGGMGLATARLLGREHLVVLSDLDPDRLDKARTHLESFDVRCAVVRCDVTDRSSVQDLAARAHSLGQVQSVVHTAGVSPSMGSAELILRVNALGTVNVARAFLKGAGDGFALVNVASSAGHLPAAFPVPKRVYCNAEHDPERMVKLLHARCSRVPRRYQTGLAYSISKNFVLWYTRELTGPFGRRGARVLSVSPGSFDTDMGRLEDNTGAGDLARLSAFGRYGTVEEIAEVLAFCAGRGPSYLTGTDILVDGGVSALRTLKDLLGMARNL